MGKVADAIEDHKWQQLSELLTDLSADIERVNLANGWFDTHREFGVGAMLIVTEVGEAFDAFREFHDFQPHYNEGKALADTAQRIMLPKPEGVPSEMADILIRLLDECARQEIDLVAATREKLAYNALRGYKHGGKAV